MVWTAPGSGVGNESVGDGARRLIAVVIVGIRVGVSVGVMLARACGVDGVRVALGVRVGVGLGVRVKVADGLRVGVAVRVGVNVAVSVAVARCVSAGRGGEGWRARRCARGRRARGTCCRGGRSGRNENLHFGGGLRGRLGGCLGARRRWRRRFAWASRSASRSAAGWPDRWPPSQSARGKASRAGQ